MYGCSTSNPNGAASTSNPPISHIRLEFLGPSAGQNRASIVPNNALLIIFPINSGTADNAAYDASCPFGAIATAYSYTRGE